MAEEKAMTQDNQELLTLDELLSSVPEKKDASETPKKEDPSEEKKTEKKEKAKEEKGPKRHWFATIALLYVAAILLASLIGGIFGHLAIGIVIFSAGVSPLIALGVIKLVNYMKEKKGQPKVEKTGISKYASKKDVFVDWIKKYLPFLAERESLFYYVLVVIGIAMLWCGYSLVFNHFTQLYGWDYSSQYVTFYYDFYDCWHTFFKTGRFPLYNTQTFLGSDNIGSNSYYGLFDPFVVAMIVFPRSWIPQMTLVMTFGKLAVSAICMRAYLRYMGISEGTARVGALAYAFSGYMNFMVGFPTTVAAVTWLPMVLLGIEKVIKERKPYILIWGLFFEGITSFFFLVVFCIWGVIYALWRYFWTIKQRNAKENWSAILMGVASFAVALMLCSFSLIPSLRESALSGRTSSIGQAYLIAIKNSLVNADPKRFFGLLFQQVGENPGRELMGLISFFYPTSGYLYLPLAVSTASYRYDAWTASIFCYTPIIILFFVGIMNSVRKKKINHLIAILLCTYLVFTNFAYYFFYAFTGNGYGRWLIVLVPEIIFYGCWAFDDRKEQPKWFPIAGTSIALVGAVLTFCATIWMLQGKTFSLGKDVTDVLVDGYFVENYYVAYETTAVSEMPAKLIWYVYYELALVIVEGVTMILLYKKKFTWKILLAFIAVEATVMGNMSFVYGSSWDLEYFNGGIDRLATTTEIARQINDKDNSFFRTYWDEVGGKKANGGQASSGEKNFANAVGTNGASTFHSLMNFDVYDYAVMMNISGGPTVAHAYDDTTYVNASWSGFYNNKRFGSDNHLGMKYYVIEKGGYGKWETANVPFGAVEIPELETKQYRVFVNNDVPTLGHAVESTNLYRLGKKANPETDDDYKYNNFYTGYTGNKPLWIEQMMIDGAIIDDDATLPSGVTADNVPNFSVTSQGRKSYTFSNMNVQVYTTTGNDRYLPGNEAWANEGPAYFLHHYTGVTKSGAFTYTGDFDKVVMTPKTGTYFNNDASSTGAYFDVNLGSTNKATRIYMIGDTTDESGNVIATDQLLSFEYRCYDVLRNCSNNQTFGMYAKGKVKYVVLCGTGGVNPNFSSLTALYVQDRANIEAKTQYLKDNSLKNVKSTGTNSYSFSTNYGENKFVVTQLGYDDGWTVKANGVKIDTYRLDGGFVGFYAPAGETTYEMSYMTPYSKGIYALVASGLAIYISYLGYDFVKTRRRLEKELDIK